MKKQWVLEAEVKTNSRTMEDILIEIFGCVSIDNMAVHSQPAQVPGVAKGAPTLLQAA